MTTSPQSMSDLPELPEPVYLARLSKDGEWAELVPSNDWTVEMWEHGTDPVYTLDQLREYGRLCRATAEQAGKVEGGQRKDGHPGIDRLWDSQWVNVVNHDDCYRDYSKEDAVAAAVQLTERKMAENFRLAKPTQSAATSDRDAYEGAREDLLDWKRRAQKAEAELRRLGYTGITPDAAPVSPSREVEALAVDVTCGDPCVPNPPVYAKGTDPEIAQLRAYSSELRRELDAIVKIAAPLFKDIDPIPLLFACGTVTEVTPYGYVRDVVEQLKRSIAPVQEKAP